MGDFFSNYSTLIVFLHIISAIIWIGGMIVIRFAIHYSMQEIQDPKIKLGRTLENLRRFFNMVIPSIILLLITAVIMILALGFKGTPLYNQIILKEIIWTVMTIIFIVILIKRSKAAKAFEKNDFSSAKQHLSLLATYLIPTNIILGLIAVILGIILRGF